MDERFTGRKHFWSAVAVDRPKSKKKFNEGIELYQEEGSFTDEEEIENIVSLTGIFPMHLVMSDNIKDKLDEYFVPPISDYDPELGVVWFIPREIIRKKTKNGKLYWIVAVIDSNSMTSKVKCWGVREGIDRIHINRPYMARLDYDPIWGFSTRSIRHNLKLLG